MEVGKEEIEVMGRLFQTVWVQGDDAANAYMADHPGWGVIRADPNGRVYMAAKKDQGKPVNPPVKRASRHRGPRKPYVPVIPPLHTLQRDLERVERRLRKLGHTDKHLEDLSRHFHLGRVGGSGRNTARLNRRREAALDKSIREAKIIHELQGQRNYLLSAIATYSKDKPA